jgi:hypothetical protein
MNPTLHVEDLFMVPCKPVTTIWCKLGHHWTIDWQGDVKSQPVCPGGETSSCHNGMPK